MNHLPTFGSGARADRTVWNGTRKAALVAAIRDGRISEADALARYGLTPDEIALWERALSSLDVMSARKHAAR